LTTLRVRAAVNPLSSFRSSRSRRPSPSRFQQGTEQVSALIRPLARMQGPVFLTNSRCAWIAFLVPKLRKVFAEFLRLTSLDTLVHSHHSTGVGFGYGMGGHQFPEVGCPLLRRLLRFRGALEAVSPNAELLNVRTLRVSVQGILQPCCSYSCQQSHFLWSFDNGPIVQRSDPRTVCYRQRPSPPTAGKVVTKWFRGKG
jgi:hypothetical protein